MRAASSSEWILCRFTSQERAAAMVGDLVEIEKQKGRLWFWFSVAGVALSLFWRRPIAFIAALYAGSWTLYCFQMAMHGMYALHRIPDGRPSAIVFDVIGIAGSTLCLLSIFAAIRYGIQERTTQMALAWTALIAAVIYFWWQPVILALCVGAALCILAASMWTSERRMESAVVLVAVAIGCAARFLFLIPAALYQRFLYGGLWGTKEMLEHPSVAWVGFSMIILSCWVATSAWSYLRGLHLRSMAEKERCKIVFAQKRTSPHGSQF
jgi:hypothetical protein